MIYEMFHKLRDGKTLYWNGRKFIEVGKELRGKETNIFQPAYYGNNFKKCGKHIVWADERMRIHCRKKKMWELI